MKVLFVASEAVPFIKTGGLADVAHALPKTLRDQGIDVRVVIPNYSAIADVYKDEMKAVTDFKVEVGWRNQFAGIQTIEQDGIPFYFVDNEYYFKRNGIYGHYDDGERFAFYTKAVLAMMEKIDFIPDVIHMNDWHTGMLSLVFKDHYSHLEKYSHIKTVYTIHNLKYQGVFPPGVLDDLLNLHMNYYNEGYIEFYGNINFMKAGILYSDAVTTVSETYAQEIQYEYYGEKLHGVVQNRNHDLYGIVNGIDYDIYNPKKDPYTTKEYDLRSVNRKADNKKALQEELGLPVNGDVPMIGMVTRLADMKGLDLVAHIVHEILENDVQLVVLGTGEHKYEAMMHELAHRYPDKVSANIRFDNGLAHRIYASSDLFLMPSRFEPCGLGQLIALRYGAIPIVRETGGLKDTVHPFNEFTGEGVGFGFSNYNAHELLYTVKNALDLYENKTLWRNLVKNAMREDNSWKSSAQIYAKLYKKLMQAKSAKKTAGKKTTSKKTAKAKAASKGVSKTTSKKTKTTTVKTKRKAPAKAKNKEITEQ